MNIVDLGFFASPSAQTALIVGSAAAAISAAAGILTIARGQSFAGHSLADVGAAGRSGPILIGGSPLAGFVVVNLVAAAIMNTLGGSSSRSRDTATGIVLACALGLAALFLYLATTLTSLSGAVQVVLFGSIFTVDPNMAALV